VKADHSAQLRLLDLQAADTTLAQLAHRRATLPELVAIANNETEAADLNNEIVEADTALGDIAGEQTRLEGEVDVVRTRSTRDDQRMQTGGLPAKELESLQHEIVSLKRRQGVLEDDLLEVMERREESESALAALRVRSAGLAAELAGLVTRRDEVFDEIDRNAALKTSERALIGNEIPADLLALYEKAREHSGGVGAAMLRARRCEGCRIELSGTELSAVRTAAPDEVVRCENCRRILVRTDESGL
jgi:predicted  nucleic acid-binding Zn-ribbon protein